MKYRVLERIAFGLVLTSALACIAYMACERNPGTYALLHEGMKALQSSSYVPDPALFNPDTCESSSINVVAGN
jgi:hypothetical protein